MVFTKKFSEFDNAGIQVEDQTVVGLEGGVNSQFTTAPQFLPAGPTSSRPITPIAGMIRYNTDLNIYEFYDGTDWQELEPTSAIFDRFPFIVGANGPYLTIQAAIDAAAPLATASTPQVVLINPGVYLEDLVLASFVHLSSFGGAGGDSVVIQGNAVFTALNTGDVFGCNAVTFDAASTGLPAISFQGTAVCVSIITDCRFKATLGVCWENLNPNILMNMADCRTFAGSGSKTYNVVGGQIRLSGGFNLALDTASTISGGANFSLLGCFDTNSFIVTGGSTYSMASSVVITPDPLPVVNVDSTSLVVALFSSVISNATSGYYIEGTGNALIGGINNITGSAVLIDPAITTVTTGTQFGSIDLLQQSQTIFMNNNFISDLLDPVLPQDAATKAYVDSISGAAGGSPGQIQYNNAGALGGDSGFTTDGAGSLAVVGQLTVDNLKFNGNTIISTNANSDIAITPNGTGDLVLDGLNWPQTAGTVGYFLQTDGVDQLSWQQVTIGSGVVNPGLINQLAWYTANGTSVSGLITANNGTLVTSGTGIPSISSTLPSAVQGNITTLGIITSGTWNGTPIDLALYVSGNLAISHLNSGTGASSSTFWRGDGTWAAPAATGNVNAGLINQMTWYAANGTTVSGLATANNGTLITGGTGVPSISSTLPNAVQTNITALGAQSQALSMNGHLINGVTDPTAAQDAATKNYVDSVVAGFNPQAAVNLASTVNLTVTYNNGASGVGATLTNAGALVVFSLDGGSPSVGQRVLIKNQTASLQNGIYTVTNVGSAIVAWVLTRATTFDTPAEINASGMVPVISGTTNAGTGWLEIATVTTIGVDPITFIQFGQTAGTVLVPGGGTGVTSFTPYALIAGGTIPTGPLQSIPTFTTDGAGALTLFGQMTIDNLNFNGNAIISTNTDGNIEFTPNGLGVNFFHKDIQIEKALDSRVRLWSGDLLRTSYSDIIDSSVTSLQISKVSATGNSTIRLSPNPLDGTSLADIEFFRFTNTTGANSVIIYLGNNTLTTNHVIRGSGGNTNLCQNNGNLAIGNGTTTQIILNATTGVTAILNDGTMAANSATALATQQSIKTYVDNAAPVKALTAGTTQTAAVNTIYIAQAAGQTTFTLPATFAATSVIGVIGSTANTGGWVIAAAAGDTIRVNNATTSAGGTVTSAATAGQVIYLMCDVANQSWIMTSTVSTTLTTT